MKDDTRQEQNLSDEREFQEQIDAAKLIMDDNKNVLARLAQ